MNVQSANIKTGLLFLVSILSLTACGGGGGGGGDSAAAPNNVPRFAYVANSNDNTVSIYSVNAATGQLRHNGYVAAGANPGSVAVDPSGKFAYVANGSSANVSAYTINASTGALTPIDADGAVPGVQHFPAGTSPQSVTIDPSGKFAYVATSDGVSAYTVNTTTGALTPIDADSAAIGIQHFPAGTNPQSVTIDPSGKFAYVANQSSSDVSAYTINTTTGALTPIDADSAAIGIQHFPAGTLPFSVTVDPAGKFAYVANWDSGSVSAYTVNASTGALTPIDADAALAGIQNFPAGTGSISVTVDPTGKFAYVANENSANVSAYTINATTGTLTPIDADAALAGIQNFPAGTAPLSITVDPSGKFAYAANQSSDNVSAYSIDPDTGALIALPTVTGRNGNTAMAMTRGTAAVTYTPKFAYVANGLDNTVSAYTIDAGTGALTSIGVAVEAGTTPQAVTVDPSGRFAYAPNDGGGVSSYTISAVTGVLTPIDYDAGTSGIQNVAAGTNPRSVTVDPSGRFVYVANWGSNTVSAFTIEEPNGNLESFAATVATGTNPRSITIAPSGRFAYVANFGSGSVSAYTIGTDGVLTPIDADPATAGIQNFPAGSQPFSVSIDLTGRFAYVANSFNGAGGNSVSAYTINATSGALAPIDADPATAGIQNFPAHINPRSVAVDPAGQFAYVANFGSNSVSVHPIHPVIGGLISAVAFPAGTNPFSVTVDPSGRFAYVANFGDDTVSAYSISSAGLTSLGLAVGSGDGPVSVTTTGTIQ